MSLNIGNEGVKAAKSLVVSSDWATLRGVLLEQARAAMNRAIEAVSGREDACGYARALRDIWMALESASTGVQLPQMPKPGPSEKR
jgi:hypothetical protein